MLSSLSKYRVGDELRCTGYKMSVWSRKPSIRHWLSFQSFCEGFHTDCILDGVVRRVVL